MSLLDRAVEFAVEKHSGMHRKLDNSPYILHPMEVACIISRMTDDEEVLAAAMLHDTVEDTDATIEEIEELFGSRVAMLVASETEDKRPDIPRSESWAVRKEESLRELEKAKDPGVKMLWLGDKLSNMHSLYAVWKKRGGEVFSLFNQSDPAKQAKYYRRVGELLSSLRGYDEWKEYRWLVEKVFGEEPEE